MSQKPYKSTRRVFWIMDNCSAHRGQKAVDRLRSQWLLVQTPVPASWLNQIEIYFSIVQRKVLTPNDFQSLNELEQRLLAFQRRCQELLLPFNGPSLEKISLSSSLKSKTNGSFTPPDAPPEYVTVIPKGST
jgi:DDE superfamily endonuclease